jgi:hypothetical protein
LITIKIPINPNIEMAETIPTTANPKALILFLTTVLGEKDNQSMKIGQQNINKEVKKFPSRFLKFFPRTINAKAFMVILTMG